MSLYIDLDLGTVTPTYATPENVSRITGVPVADLVQPEKLWYETDPDGMERSEEYADDYDYYESLDYCNGRPGSARQSQPSTAQTALLGTANHSAFAHRCNPPLPGGYPYSPCS